MLLPQCPFNLPVPIGEKTVSEAVPEPQNKPTKNGKQYQN